MTTQSTEHGEHATGVDIAMHVDNTRAVAQQLRHATVRGVLAGALGTIALIFVAVAGLSLLGGFSPIPIIIGLVGLLALGGAAWIVWRGNGRALADVAPASSTWMAEPSDHRDVVHAQRSIAAAFEIERRRIERDLHDGAQQYLVATSMDVGEAAFLLEGDASGAVSSADLQAARERMASAQDRAELALTSLRRTVAGIHPKVLSDLGLEAAVHDLVVSAPVPATLRVPSPLPEIPEGVIAAAYFTVAEALTNVAKHAPAATVTVLLIADDDLHLSITDTGPGGVIPGSGLRGIGERLAIFGGSLRISSPVGGPTEIRARIPLLLHRGEWGSGAGVAALSENPRTEGTDASGSRG
ncbi:sensor histidine kinase [Actinotignum timonense]|uniref:sensor histidine kinase n=1 Tax=Actinotignum timonense TaxID=1870995 RepID=UPI002551AE4A|nr:histidine kinase [Actinotignum timonense]MDK8781673.1 histidine kinase [Actinotignum timonense]